MQTASFIKTAMEKTLSILEEDLRTLRPGRASAELVGTLPVAAYNGTMPLNQVASLSANDQGQLIVQPWDKSVVAAAENAIRQSQLGFSVINEGAQLRLSVPPLSQERRQEFVRLAHQKGEAARIQLRQTRTEALQHASKEKASGLIREDDLNRFTKDLNDLIEQFNTRVKSVVEAKEKELMSS